MLTLPGLTPPNDPLFYRVLFDHIICGYIPLVTTNEAARLHFGSAKMYFNEREKIFSLPQHFLPTILLFQFYVILCEIVQQQLKYSFVCVPNRLFRNLIVLDSLRSFQKT